jgi:hypothetical protein
MRKQVHPRRAYTKLQQTNGALYKKKWVFFKRTMPLEESVRHQDWKDLSTPAEIELLIDVEIEHNQLKEQLGEDNVIEYEDPWELIEVETDKGFEK